MVVFVGRAGSGWALQFQDEKNPFHEPYKKVAELGVVLEICDYCSEEFNVKGKLSDQQRTLLSGDYEGHPSLVRWIEKGYHVLIL